MLGKNIITTILVVSLPFIVLFTLGTWQLFRLSWKNNIIVRMDMPSVKIDDSKTINDFIYRKIVIEGILSGIDLYIFAGTNSYYVLTPMLLSSGEYVLINKGLIDKGLIDKKQTEAIVKPKKVVISGTLYCDSNMNLDKLIKNKGKNNVWPWLDVQSISKDIGVIFNPCVIWVSNKLSNDVVPTVLHSPRNYHMQYMITWYTLALIWLIISYVKSKSNFTVDHKHHKIT